MTVFQALLRIPASLEYSSHRFILSRMLLRGCLLYLVLLISIAVCTELVSDEEFVVIDGIRVRADSIKNETNNFDGKNKREKESGEQGKDDIIEEQPDDDGSDDDDDGEESDNEEDDDLEATKHLPTKCHGKIESFT